MKVKLLVAVVLIFLFSGCGNSEQEQKKSQARVERFAVAEKRMEAWAYVKKEKVISPTETLKLIGFPSDSKYSADHPRNDTYCLIYTNSEYKTAHFVCPGSGGSSD